MTAAELKKLDPILIKGLMPGPGNNDAVRYIGDVTGLKSEYHHDALDVQAECELYKKLEGL